MAALAASVAGVATFNGRTGSVTLLASDLSAAGGALLASPAFTGTPTAPTAALNTSTTQLATTAFVLGQASTTVPLMDGTAAAGAGTTWARSNHVHPVDTSRYSATNPSGFQTAAQVSASLANYLPLSGGTLSGNLNIANNANFGLGSSGGNNSLTFGAGWAWTWASANGTMVWQNPNGGVGWQMNPGSPFLAYNPIGPVGGNGPYADISDGRAKQEITPTDVGLNEILAIEPISFRRRQTGRGETDPRSLELGFSAQQLQSVIVEAVVAVDNTDDPLLAINTTALVAALVNAVKTLAARVEVLEAA
jgi:hypothetical protein